MTFSKDKNCLACEKGKQHKASFKTKRSFSINKCLYLLHMDLFGPVKPQTISYNKYTLFIIDEYSRQMENLNEVKVKELRSDNRTEFRNHNLEEFYDEKGISHNFSSLSTSMYLDVLCTFIIIEITRESLMKKLMMDSFLVTLKWPRHLGTEEDAINFNENISFSDDEFLGLVSPKEPPMFKNPDDHPTSNEVDNLNSTDDLEPADVQENVINRWSKENHIELVNIIREPMAFITTRTRVRDSKAVSAHECLYVNFLSEMEPKKLIEALEEE
ncbi:retrovirus-related pol polyprotein from transposon TNT 1-94 [Tanacetum coccineum]